MFGMRKPTGWLAIVLLTSIAFAGDSPPDAKPSYRPAARIVPADPWPSRKKVYAPKSERLDHPPMLNPIPAVPSVAYGGPVSFGPYTSVQVNVNGTGNNVPNDAANEPTLAIDPRDPNRMAIAWRQFDTVASNFRQLGRAYSTDGGATWTFPGVLDPGQFRSDPVLSVDGFGVFYLASLSSTTSVEVFRSTDGGAYWVGPFDAYGGDKPWLVADRRLSGLGAGFIAQFWTAQYSCCPPGDFSRSINSALAFQSPIAIPPPSMKWGTMDTGPDGTLYLIGATSDQMGHVFARSSNAMDPVVAPTFELIKNVSLGGQTGGFGGFSGPNPTGLLGQVWLVAHPTRAGHLYVLGSVIPATPDPMEVMFIRSTDNGQSWSEPVRVNDDPPETNAWQWFGTFSIAPNGRLDAAWNDTRTTGKETDSAVFYSYSHDQGVTWSPNVQVTPVFNSHAGFPQQAKLGDYYHMISDNGGANLAYAATFNGEQDIYFLRIPRDCNDNGIDDDCDVACGEVGSRCDVPGCGESSDCNGNFVPDECEPDDDCNENKFRDICEIGSNPDLDCNMNGILDACEEVQDCNNNGISDLCDIANGTSLDCNGNGVPDECDIARGSSEDRDFNGVPDECLGACCLCFGCEALALFECAQQKGSFGGGGTICADPGVCHAASPANNHCVEATNLGSAAPIELALDNHCASGDPFASGMVPCPAPQPFGADLWYRYTAPCTGALRVSMCENTNFDAILAVYGGEDLCQCPLPETPAFSCADDSCGIGGGPPFVEIGVTAGRCYLIRAGGWNGSVGTGSLSLEYSTPCTPPPLVAEPGGLEKNRFISLVVPPNLSGNQCALRVRLTSLHDAPEPSDAPDFSAFEGQHRYVALFRDEFDEPVFECPDPPFGQYRCARLSCVPEYRDWAAELNNEVLHVTGNAIVPLSRYDVAWLPNACLGQEASCPSASTELLIRTALWGDVIPGQLDMKDIAGLTDKIKQLTSAPRMPHAVLVPDEPRPHTRPVNVIDLGNAVNALGGVAYPFPISSCP